MRAATLSDSEAIESLENLLFDNSMGARMIRQELSLGAGWVHFEEELLTGYVLVRDEEQIRDITRLGVHPTAQRRGVGTLLLHKALEGASTVILTVQKDNLGAMKLYAKYGFEIVAHLHAANAWVMKRCNS
jgi:ribosomal-protein-alanine N-acetyltransferase